MAFGASITGTHCRAVSACFVCALSRSVSIWCWLDKRYLASGDEIGMGGRCLEGQRGCGRKDSSKLFQGYIFWLGCNYPTFFKIYQEGGENMILGGKMGLSVFLSVCMNYVNTQMVSFVLGD